MHEILTAQQMVNVTFHNIILFIKQFPISVAIVVLIEFLSPCAEAGVKHLVLFSAGSGGCTYSVGGHSRCHNIAF